MPYSGLQRGMTQFGAGLGQAMGQRRDNKNMHKALFTAYDNMPELQEMIPGLNPDDVSANEAASYMQAFGTMLDVGRQTLKQQQLQQSMQQERQRQMYADSFGVDRATDPSNLTPKERYLQRGGNDPALIRELMQFGEQQQGIQFDEDPVSGQRFATYGRSMAGSGVNPARVAEGADPERARQEKQHRDRLERTFVREGGFGDQQQVTSGQYWNETRLPDGRIRPGAKLDPSIERWLELLDDESMELYGRPAFGRQGGGSAPQGTGDITDQFFRGF